MRKFLLVAFALLLTAGVALAEGAYIQGRVLQDSTPIYQDRYVQIPHQTCRDVTTYHGNGGNILGGMIIGGLVGKGLTGDDGGAAAGAVIGGIIGAENNPGGYRTRRVCERYVTNELVTEVIGYKTRVRTDVGTVSLTTSRRYLRGSIINFDMNCNGC